MRASLILRVVNFARKPRVVGIKPKIGVILAARVVRVEPKIGVILAARVVRVEPKIRFILAAWIEWEGMKPQMVHKMGRGL